MIFSYNGERFKVTTDANQMRLRQERLDCDGRKFWSDEETTSLGYSSNVLPKTARFLRLIENLEREKD